MATLIVIRYPTKSSGGTGEDPNWGILVLSLIRSKFIVIIF
jgi:hypothetical protein